MNIKSQLSLAFYPQTDRQTKRVNQVLKQYLRCFINYEQDNWTSLLPFAEFAYNNAQHSTTSLSPFFANYGYHPKSDFLVTLSSSHTTSSSPAALDSFQHLKLFSFYLKEQIAHAQTLSSHYANSHRLSHIFKVGDQVWLYTHNLSTTRPSSKLDYKCLGPFTILKQINLVTFQL